MGFSPERLSDARRSLGLKQVELARLSGLSQTMISLYETGARVPSDEATQALAKALCVPSSWLRGDDDALPITEGMSPELLAFIESDAGRNLNLSEADILHLARFDPFPGELMASLMLSSVRRGLGLDPRTGRPKREGTVAVLLGNGGQPAGVVDVPRNALPRVLRAAGVESIYVECEDVDDWSAFGAFDETLMPGGPRAPGDAEGQGGEEGGPEG